VEYSVVARAAAARAALHLVAGDEIDWHEHRVSTGLMNGAMMMIDPNKDVNEVTRAIVMAGKQNGCVILAAARRISLQVRRSESTVYPEGRQRFIQITTDSVAGEGSRGYAAEAVSRADNPGVRPTWCHILRFDDRVPCSASTPSARPAAPAHAPILERFSAISRARLPREARLQEKRNLTLEV
jgi:hypothetical protein